MHFLLVSTKHTVIPSVTKWIKPKLLLETNIFQAHKNNIRSTLKLKKVLLVNKKNCHDLSINQNDTPSTDDLQLANIFNNSFSQIGS